MRIVVIGGTGLVGSKLVHGLTERGHDAVAAPPSTGVNTYTGEGLPEVLAGASVVVDVSNSPTLDDAAMDFFRTERRGVCGDGLHCRGLRAADGYAAEGRT